MAESKRELAYTRGWLVHQSHDPSETPVMVNGSVWVRLDDNGNQWAV